MVPFLLLLRFWGVPFRAERSTTKNGCSGGSVDVLK